MVYKKPLTSNSVKRIIKFMKLKTFVAPLFLLTFLGCATGYQNPNLPNLAPEKEYFRAVVDFTAKQQVYDGLYQKMEFDATLLNSKVARLQVDESARIYQWSEDQYKNKKSETETNLSKQTDVFLGFFVPERKQDDLQKSSTLWKIFLDVNGKRYEAKVTKIKTIHADVVSLYPHQSRFYTPYKLTFAVPATQVDNAASKLTLTGPVGSTSVDFKPIQ